MLKVTSFFFVILRMQQASQLAPLPTRQTFLSSTTRHRSLGRIDRGAHVTAVAASHTSGKKNTPKKNRGGIFFGVIHYASQLAGAHRP